MLNGENIFYFGFNAALGIVLLVAKYAGPNAIIGYRTPASRKSAHAWRFAHACAALSIITLNAGFGLVEYAFNLPLPPIRFPYTIISLIIASAVTETALFFKFRKNADSPTHL